MENRSATDKEVIADRLNEIPKIVFSNTITKAPWGEWKEAEIIAGEALTAIKKLKLLAGKDMVMWGSISIAQSLMRDDLIDEYHLQLCPIITGGGRTLFPEQMNYSQLKLVEVRKYDTGTIFLNYQRIK